MTHTKEDKAVLKILVEKELQNVEENGDKVMISNSPFIHKVVQDESDLKFLKNVELYKEFLQQLLKRL